jgi:hypothetical protein
MYNKKSTKAVEIKEHGKGIFDFSAEEFYKAPTLDSPRPPHGVEL